MKKIIIVFLFFVFQINFSVFAEPSELSIDDFIKQACENDTQFKKILKDQLKIKYEKSFNMPSKDLILSVESKYNFLFDPDERDVENSVSLSKLFSNVGTEVEVEYSSTLSKTTREVKSDVAFEISQPIARNAFGKDSLLLDKIIGVEMDVAQYQVVEAYEDYLASLIQLYYDWYSAYENLTTAVNSYNENLKLLENIKQRRKNKIALPIDVNKVSLQVLTKKENLIVLKEKYNSYFNKVKASIRSERNSDFKPIAPLRYIDTIIHFESDYEDFETKSRTIEIIDLLEKKSSLNVDRQAQDLLPSIDLILGVKLDGVDQDVSASSESAYAAVSVQWPFPAEEERAEYEVSKLDLEGLRLNNESVRSYLYTTLKSLSDQMKKEVELISVAKEKISLSADILQEETRNYSVGNSNLNDLIDSVNKLEENKFNKIYHDIQFRKLIVEWLRITDSLISNIKEGS